MLIHLCHTYNPTWAFMAKALPGAHGVEELKRVAAEMEEELQML